MKLPVVLADRIAGVRPFQVRGAATLKALAAVFFFMVAEIKSKFVPEERRLREGSGNYMIRKIQRLTEFNIERH